MSEVVVRASIAAGIAFAVAMLIGPITIKNLRKLRAGQVVRDDGPQSHLKKSGTPSMGGVIIIVSLLLGSAAATPGYSMLPWALFITTGCGLVGMLDDYISIVSHRSLGLRARQKILFQLIFGLILGAWAYSNPNIGSEIIIPFSDGRMIDLGIWYIPFTMLVLVASANAVNLSDGLDGLASGTMAIASFAYVAVASSVGHGEAGAFAGAVGGACLGFIWWNAYPAAIFMGDTGSLALGAALASMAVLTRTELLLLVIGGVYVAEAMSDVIQVAYFKLTGKRVFRMAPIHHHFELKGVPEPKIVVRFWIVAAFLAALGFAAL